MFTRFSSPLWFTTVNIHCVPEGFSSPLWFTTANVHVCLKFGSIVKDSVCGTHLFLIKKNFPQQFVCTLRAMTRSANSQTCATVWTLGGLLTTPQDTFHVLPPQ